MEKRTKTQIATVGNKVDSFLALGQPCANNEKFWRWGDDNLFPAALALMSRRSSTHRRIINDKADYISGKGFTFDAEVPLLGEFVASVNGTGESLRQVMNKLAFDKSLFGNAFLEIVTDAHRLQSPKRHYRRETYQKPVCSSPDVATPPSHLPKRQTRPTEAPLHRR